jgi:hypothetical protein
MTRHPTAHSDVIEALEATLAHGAIDIEMSDYGAAVNFRQRCYRYRKALLTQSATDLKELKLKGLAKPGLLPSTPYDGIVIKALEQGENVLRFRVEKNEIRSRMRLPGGEALPATAGLEDEAAVLRNKLGLE